MKTEEQKTRWRPTTKSYERGNHDQAYGEWNEDRRKPRPGIRRTKRRRGRNPDKAYGERNEDEGKPTGDIAMGWLPFDRLTWRCEGFLTGFSTGEPSHRLGEVVTKPAFLRRLTCVAVAFRMIEEETSSIGYCQQQLINLCTNTMTPQGYASIVIQEWQSYSVTLTYFETVLYG